MCGCDGGDANQTRSSESGSITLHESSQNPTRTKKTNFTGLSSGNLKPMPSHLSTWYHHVCVVEEKKMLLTVPLPITVPLRTYRAGMHLCWNMTKEYLSPVWCVIKAQNPSSGLAGRLRPSDADAHKGRRHRYGATVLESSN